MTSLYARLEKKTALYPEYFAHCRRPVVHGAWPAEIYRLPSAGPPMTTLLYVQGVIEIVGGILLLLIGAYTRVVTLFSPGIWPQPISWRIPRVPSSLQRMAETRQCCS